jgi:epoxyqueuosine reductase
MISDAVAALLGRLGVCSFGVCRWADELLIAGVRSAARLPQTPSSVLVCAFPYGVGERDGRNLSLYAMLPDYHAVVLSALEEVCAALRAEAPDAAFVPFCDSSPVREVEAGVRCAVGVRGKNGMLITKESGSLVFLGEIVTDLPWDACEKAGSCIGCGACIAACPTGALTDGGLDVSRCLSHITQKKGALSEEEAALVRQGGLVWGCDRCQLVCPMNRGAKQTAIPAFRDSVTPTLTRRNLDAMMRNRAFSWRGRAVLERNLKLFEGDGGSAPFTLK